MGYKVDYEKSDRGIYIMDLNHIYSDGSKYETDLFCIKINSPKPGVIDTEYTLGKISGSLQIIGVDLIW
jgi:hypothetical protein